MEKKDYPPISGLQCNALYFTDSCKTVQVFVQESNLNLLGHLYRFNPLKGKLVRDSMDQADLHYFTFRKPCIPAGTEVTVDCYWRNFYGVYFNILYNGEHYDIRTQDVEILI